MTSEEYNLSDVMDPTDEITKLLIKYAKMHDAKWVSARVNMKKGEYSVHYG